MKKKSILIMALIACLMLAGTMVFTACSKEEPETEVMTEEQTIEDLKEAAEGEQEVDLTDLSTMDPEEENLPATLEEALPALREAGYMKTQDGYKATDNVDGVRSVRIITAKENTVKADLTYDYGSANEEMVKFFKKDEDNAVSTMVAQYLVVLADRSTATDGKLEYVIHVGSKKVKSGTMTLKEARKYQEEAFE